MSSISLIDTTELNRLESDRFSSLNENGQENMLCGLTPVKIKHYLMMAAGAASVLVGSLIAASPVLGIIAVSAPLPLSLLFIAAGGIIFLVSAKYFDYQDPSQLEAYRSSVKDRFENIRFIEKRFETDNSPSEDKQLVKRLLGEEMKSFLDDVSKEHGWENMFYFGIPAPADFTQIYRYAADHMDVNEMIGFYEKVSEEYQNVKNLHGEDLFAYQIPQPGEWRAKWDEEIEDLDARKILKKYDIEKLKVYGIISEAEAQKLQVAKQEYARIQESFQNEGDTHFRAYQDLKGPHKETYLRKIREAEDAYSNHNCHRSLQELSHSQIDEMGFYRRQKDGEIKAKEEELQCFYDGLTDQGNRSIEDLEPPLQVRWAAKQREIEESKREIENRYGPSFNQVSDKYAFLRADYVRQEAAARSQRDDRIEEANDWYKDTMQPLKERRDQLAGDEIVDERRRRIDVLQQIYLQA